MKSGSTVTVSAAKGLIEACVAKAAQLKVPVCAAVVDASGYLVMLYRMEEASFLSPQIAEAKAFTAAAWRCETSAVAERARARPETFQAFASVGRVQIIPGEGGRPIFHDGVCIGALGVSGGSAAQDRAICNAGFGEGGEM